MCVYVCGMHAHVSSYSCVYGHKCMYDCTWVCVYEYGGLKSTLNNFLDLVPLYYQGRVSDLNGDLPGPASLTSQLALGFLWLLLKSRYSGGCPSCTAHVWFGGSESFRPHAWIGSTSSTEPSPTSWAFCPWQCIHGVSKSCHFCLNSPISFSTGLPLWDVLGHEEKLLSHDSLCLFVTNHSEVTENSDTGLVSR